ncbi:MAG: hypothetical protein GEU95_05680 [Rhizobiales bacterium]|nr:hypothetical protein [Hyphomicrobiales bacterium]
MSDALEKDTRASTFSDNVVISTPTEERYQHFLQVLGMIQLSSACGGFLLRGGITIGDIVHDGEAVFGPALIRAYDLERLHAQYPRVILDPEAIADFGKLPAVVVEEKGSYFIDPFHAGFIEWLSSLQKADAVSDFIEAGIPAPTGLMRRMWDDNVLKAVLHILKQQIREPIEDKDWDKVAWLYDRIAGRLGVPPARSYPRARPRDLVE